MGATAYIGRVGRLAVALGVGTAVVTGHGIASADETTTTPTTSTTTSDTTTPSDTERSSAPETPTEPTTPTEPRESEPVDSDSTSPDTVAPGTVNAQTNTGSITTPGPTQTPEPTESELEGEEPDADTEEPEAPEPEPESNDSSHPLQERKIAPEPVEVLAAKQDSEPSPVLAKSTATPEPETAFAAMAAPTSQRAAATTRSMAVEPAAAATPNPLEIVANLVSNVVSMVLGPIVGSGPSAPAEPPLAWALLAFARREFENFVAAVTGGGITNPVVAAQTTSLALAAPLAAAAVNVPGFPLPGAQLSPSTKFVQWVTGNYQPGNELIADTLARFGVSGTDVGTMWDNGIVDDPRTPYNEHQVLMAFGDTFGLRSVPGEDWRFNVLMRSADTDLSNGMEVPDGEFGNGNWFGGMPLWDVPPGRPYENYARRIINPEALPFGLAPGITLIPTAGIALPTTDVGAIGGMKQYLSFMSVRQWGAAGQWTTNYSGIAYSIDNGENWKIAPTSIRQNDPWSGNANFQQAAFVRPGDGYVYSYGTPNGRQGAAYVSRVLEKDILDVTKYDYYSKGAAGGFFGWGSTPAGWYRNQPAKATAIFGGAEQGACGAVNPGSQVSEFSVQYNKQLKKYVTLYGDQFNNIVMRTSDTPQGTWSSAKVLLPQQSGGIYAPMMHPWSPSTMGTGSDLYWNLSLWSEYNVMLMKTDLTKV